jgi:hypothetical protein
MSLGYDQLRILDEDYNEADVWERGRKLLEDIDASFPASSHGATFGHAEVVPLGASLSETPHRPKEKIRS